MTQDDALTILKAGRSAFLTGPAGSGKTHVLNAYLAYLRNHGVEVGITASTGIAATHIGGMTIHAWSGMGIAEVLSDDAYRKIMDNKQYAKRFERVKVLVVDEVSMLDARRLDIVDRILRLSSFTDKPFGGKQVIFSGDFFQLPPIARQGAPVPRFACYAEGWLAARPAILYLESQYRQSDGDLLNILARIRSGTIDGAARKALEARIHAPLDGTVEATNLFCHNVDVDGLNQRKLHAIAGKPFTYRMERSGPRKLVDGLVKSCLAPEELVLKKGTAVMFVRNNFEEGYVNGTLGTVIDFQSGMPVVRMRDGRELQPKAATWALEDGGQALAEIRQLPLRLAWAMTVHKSQGMSLDAARIDLTRSFEAGMGYVALSRVRKLTGLSLLGLNETALQVREEARLLDEAFRAESARAAAGLATLTKEKVQTLHRSYITSVGSSKPIKAREAKVSTLDKTKERIAAKLPLEAIAEERGLTLGTIVGHIEKLAERGDLPDILYLKRVFSAERLAEIEHAFEASGDTKLAPVRTLLGDSASFDELRLARALLFAEKASMPKEP